MPSAPTRTCQGPGARASPRAIHERSVAAAASAKNGMVGNRVARLLVQQQTEQDERQDGPEQRPSAPPIRRQACQHDQQQVAPIADVCQVEPRRLEAARRQPLHEREVEDREQAVEGPAPIQRVRHANREQERNREASEEHRGPRDANVPCGTGLVGAHPIEDRQHGGSGKHDLAEAHRRAEPDQDTGERASHRRRGEQQAERRNQEGGRHDPRQLRAAVGHVQMADAEQRGREQRRPAIAGQREANPVEDPDVQRRDRGDEEPARRHQREDVGDAERHERALHREDERHRIVRVPDLPHRPRLAQRHAERHLVDLDVVAGDEAEVREHVGHADDGREHDQDADDAQGGSGIDGVQPAAQRREPCRGRPPDLGKGPAGYGKERPRRRQRAQDGDQQEPDDQVAGRPGPQQMAADGDGPWPGHDRDQDDERGGRPEEIQQERQGGHDESWEGTGVDHGAPDVRTASPHVRMKGNSSIDAGDGASARIGRRGSGAALAL